MGWCIIRWKIDHFQLYTDLNQTPSAGEWRAAGNGLPMIFDKHFQAVHKMYQLMEEGDGWHYEVDEYLR